MKQRIEISHIMFSAVILWGYLLCRSTIPRLFAGRWDISPAQYFVLVFCIGAFSILARKGQKND